MFMIAIMAIKLWYDSLHVRFLLYFYGVRERSAKLVVCCRRIRQCWKDHQHHRWSHAWRIWNCRRRRSWSRRLVPIPWILNNSLKMSFTLILFQCIVAAQFEVTLSISIVCCVICCTQWGWCSNWSTPWWYLWAHIWAPHSLVPSPHAFSSTYLPRPPCVWTDMCACIVPYLTLVFCFPRSW